MEEKSKNGFRWEFRQCVDCGKKFVAKSPRAVRCIDCRKIHDNELNNIRSRERYQRNKTMKKKSRQTTTSAEDRSNVTTANIWARYLYVTI